MLFSYQVMEHCINCSILKHLRSDQPIIEPLTLHNMRETIMTEQVVAAALLAVPAD